MQSFLYSRRSVYLTTTRAFSKKKKHRGGRRAPPKTQQQASPGPHEPFGLSKQQIIQLKNGIASSHQHFYDDWKYVLLTSNDQHTVDLRKQVRHEFVKEARASSMRNLGLLETTKNMLQGTALYERMEEEGIREDAEEFLAANAVWVYESVAKKCMYEFPSIYTHILDEIFNQQLFQGDKKNYLLESGAISPQLAQVIATRVNALAEGGIKTAVKVRSEASPPNVVGYASRLQLLALQDTNPLPKALSLLHIPGGAIHAYGLPRSSYEKSSVCVHIMIHTHETYTFTQNGKSHSAKLNTPRILTLNGHFDTNETPSESSVRKFREETELAAIEDRNYDLFAHNPEKYKKAYPDGNQMSDNLGIEWQLADIDFLVARTQGWIAMGKDSIQVKDRFCYQPPIGHLNYTKDYSDAMEEENMMPRPFAMALVALFEPVKLVLLCFLIWMSILLNYGYSEDDIEELEWQLLPRSRNQEGGDNERADGETVDAATPDGRES